MGSGASLNLGGGDLTIELWAYSDVDDNVWRCVCEYDREAVGEYSLWRGGDDKVWGRAGHDGTCTVTSASDLTKNAWHHIAYVYDHGDTIHRLYLNGSQDASNDGESTSWASSSGTLRVGARQTDVDLEEWDGKIDELRISKSVRSAAWIAASHTSQNSPTTFYSLSDEESASTGGTARRIGSPIGSLISIPFQG